MLLRSLDEQEEKCAKLDGLKAEIAEFMDESMDGDYDNLLNTVCNYCEVD